MKIDTDSILSVTEVNQNFSRASKLVEKKGQVFIFKNNKLRFLLIDMERASPIEMSDDEKIDFVAARILREHKAAFLELAQ